MKNKLKINNKKYSYEKALTLLNNDGAGAAFNSTEKDEALSVFLSSASQKDRFVFNVVGKIGASASSS